MASSSKKGGKKGKAARAAAARQPAKTAASEHPKATQGMSGWQKVTWYSLIVLVIAVPLAMSNMNWMIKLFPGATDTFGVPFTYDQFDIVKVFVMRACALVGFGAWAFGFFMRGGTLRRTRADWMILALLAWILLTSFTSIHPATAIFGKYRRFEGWLSFLTYAVVFFLIVQVVDRPSRIRALAAALMASAGLVSAYAVAQYLGLDPVNWGTKLPFEFNRGFATYGNPDLLGGYLVFPLVLGPALALSEKKTLWRWVYWGVFFVTVIAWITAFVRGAWIGGTVGLLVVGVAAWRVRPKLETADYTAFGVTAAGAVAVVGRSLANPHPVLNFWERLTSIVKFNEGSALTRFEIWQAAVNATKARPILGFGADTFRLVFPRYKPMAYTKDAGYISVADNVHNYPLQMSSAIGIPGVLLLYSTFGWILWLAAPNAFAKGKGADRLVVTGFWAAALGYIAHLMTGLSVTGSTIFLWIAFAIVLAPIARPVEVKAPAWGAAVAVTCLALVVALSIGNVVYIVADNYYLRGQFNMAGAGRTPVDEIKTAIALNPYNDMYRSQLGQAYTQQMSAWAQEVSRLRGQNQDSAQAEAQVKQAFEDAVKAYRDVMVFVPSEYDNYVFLAALYNQAAAMYGPQYAEEAIKVAQEGQRVEPYGPLIRYQEAVAQYSLGRTDLAQKQLEAAIKQDPAFAEAYAMLGDIYERTGRRAEALALYRALLSRDPSSTTAADGMARIEGSAAAPASKTP